MEKCPPSLTPTPEGSGTLARSHHSGRPRPVGVLFLPAGQQLGWRRQRGQWDPSFERVQVPPVSRHPFIGLTFVCGNESEVGMKPHRGYPTCGARKQAPQRSLPPDTPTPPCQAEPQDGRSWSSQRKTPGVRCAGDAPQGADPKRVALETESLVVAGSGGSTLGGLGQGLPETRQAGLCDSCREGPGTPAWGGHGRHLGAGRPLGRRAGSGRSESVVALMADHQFIWGVRSQTDNCNSGSK